MERETLLLLATAVLAVIGLVLAFAAHRRISLTRRSLSVISGTFEGSTILDALASYVERARAVGGDLSELAARQDELLNQLARSARNVGLVRYDAFEDMGGRMSFSVAILNDYGDGVVITSINGRTEARTYAKSIDRSTSDHNLSPEESQAIAEALGRLRARR